MHWESIGNSENDNHCLNFKSNYDKMKITSIKVNLIKYFFMRNWVLKTLYSRGFTSIEVVFHCNGCIAFSGNFFSGGTSKEVRPLERGDSPRMSRRLRPDERSILCLCNPRQKANCIRWLFQWCRLQWRIMIRYFAYWIGFIGHTNATIVLVQSFFDKMCVRVIGHLWKGSFTKGQ